MRGMRPLVVMLAPVIALVIVASTLAFQGPRTIPLCRKGECIDEVNGVDREGQPQWCANYATQDWDANCECQRDCKSNAEPSGCKTFCRRKACHCDHGCDTR
jgi:hypothetical protein